MLFRQSAEQEDARSQNTLSVLLCWQQTLVYLSFFLSVHFCHFFICLESINILSAFYNYCVVGSFLSFICPSRFFYFDVFSPLRQSHDISLMWMTRLIFSEFDIDRAHCMDTRGAVLRLACLVSHSLKKRLSRTHSKYLFILKIVLL